MSLVWFGTVVDCRDPEALAAFWCAALGYRVIFRDAREVVIARGTDSTPRLVFVRAPGRKRGRNRLHLDLDPDDRDAEAGRLQELGATKIGVRQPTGATWVVLADPEGNEFCLRDPQGQERHRVTQW
jgi:catechol 2,3-dioxygenase-like lactoylglutathione lyase family enzyme